MVRDKRSILIVDSSPSSIFYVSMLLRKLEYGVQTVSNAEDALGLIARSAPAAVITDTVLPRMSGIDLLKQVKNTESISFIPVMIHTAEANPALKDTCVQAGCAGFFFKPIGPEMLFRTIQTTTEAMPRKNIRINVALKARVDGGAPRFEVVTSLSENGLYLKTTAPEPLNTLVPLTLFINDHAIRLTAHVLYSSAKAGGSLHAVPGMGMRFGTILPEDRDRIREFIREQVASSLSIGNDVQ